MPKHEVLNLSLFRGQVPTIWRLLIEKPFAALHPKPLPRIFVWYEQRESPDCLLNEARWKNVVCPMAFQERGVMKDCYSGVVDGQSQVVSDVTTPNDSQAADSL